MNPNILAGIMKNFYDDFNINDFHNRLKIQKIVYLMNCKGLSLGYSFGIYMYGPYCADLTNDAYQMTELIDFKDAQKVIPTDENKQKIFLEFLSKIKGSSKENDFEWLEIVSSYLFLKKNTNENDDEIIKTIMNKRKGFDIPIEKIKEIIKEIKKDGFFI